MMFSGEKWAALEWKAKTYKSKWAVLTGNSYQIRNYCPEQKLNMEV